MAKYKKLFPYLLTGCMVLTGCYGPTTDGVVLEKKDNKVFVDTDNDKLADQMIEINNGIIKGHTIPKYQAFYDYVLPGDSVVFEPLRFGGRTHIKSVNDKSLDKIHELVKIRGAHNGKLR